MVVTSQLVQHPVKVAPAIGKTPPMYASHNTFIESRIVSIVPKTLYGQFILIWDRFFIKPLPQVGRTTGTNCELAAFVRSNLFIASALSYMRPSVEVMC